jgi:hypothetical protein
MRPSDAEGNTSSINIMTTFGGTWMIDPSPDDITQNEYPRIPLLIVNVEDSAVSRYASSLPVMGTWKGLELGTPVDHWISLPFDPDFT